MARKLRGVHVVIQLVHSFRLHQVRRRIYFANIYIPTRGTKSQTLSKYASNRRLMVIHSLYDRTIGRRWVELYLNAVDVASESSTEEGGGESTDESEYGILVYHIHNPCSRALLLLYSYSTSFFCLRDLIEIVPKR